MPHSSIEQQRLTDSDLTPIPPAQPADINHRRVEITHFVARAGYPATLASCARADSKCRWQARHAPTGDFIDWAAGRSAFARHP